MIFTLFEFFLRFFIIVLMLESRPYTNLERERERERLMVKKIQSNKE